MGQIQNSSQIGFRKMSDIEQHPLREDLAKFSQDGLRTFKWNELDKPSPELFKGIGDWIAELMKENKFDIAKLKLYYHEYKNQYGIRCFEFRNPYRSGELKLKKNKLSKSLNCGVEHKYRVDWTWTINNKTYILMRAEIPLNHLWNIKDGKMNRSGSVFYAGLITRLMYSTYPKDKWDETTFNDKNLISEWIYVGGGHTEEHLIIYYLKEVNFEVERMHLFEPVLTSKQQSWKEYFLERESEIARIRTEVMGFPMDKRIYSYYANAFEFAFQVPDIIDYIEEDDRILSVEHLLNTGLSLGKEGLKQKSKLRDSKRKGRTSLKIPKRFQWLTLAQTKSHMRKHWTDTINFY